MSSKFATVAQTMRPPFLLLTPACVLLGIGTASRMTDLNPLLVTLVMVGAVCAHISVNMLNEYFDFRSGLDNNTQRTPFSGGSGALPANPSAASAVLAGGLVALAICCALGLYFVWLRGWLLLPIGIMGSLIILTYTQWINRAPLLCLIAAGLGFGPLMVEGTHLVLTGHYSSLALFLSLVPFFLVNDLLLLNQYPDIDADRAAGRRHFLIRYGLGNSNMVFALFMFAAFSVLLLAVSGGLLSKWALLALVPLPLGLRAVLGAFRFDGNVEPLKPAMAMNVVVNLATPALIGLTLLF